MRATASEAARAFSGGDGLLVTAGPPIAPALLVASSTLPSLVMVPPPLGAPALRRWASFSSSVGGERLGGGGLGPRIGDAARRGEAPLLLVLP
jgi:hypothetical protein